MITLLYMQVVNPACLCHFTILAESKSDITVHIVQLHVRESILIDLLIVVVQPLDAGLCSRLVYYKALHATGLLHSFKADS